MKTEEEEIWKDCPHCGRRILVFDKYCQYCGAKQTDTMDKVQ